MKSTLLQLTDEARAAIARLLEVGASEEAFNDTLEPLSDDIEAKKASYGYRIETFTMVERNHLANAEEFRAQMEAELAEAERARKAIDQLESNIAAYLTITNQEVASFGRYDYPYLPNPKKVSTVVDIDPALLPEGYRRWIEPVAGSWAPDKVKIKSALGKGEVIEGCSLTEPVKELKRVLAR